MTKKENDSNIVLFPSTGITTSEPTVAKTSSSDGSPPSKEGYLESRIDRLDERLWTTVKWGLAGIASIVVFTGGAIYTSHKDLKEEIRFVNINLGSRTDKLDSELTNKINAVDVRLREIERSTSAMESLLARRK
jgi:hypothetical protein